MKCYLESCPGVGRTFPYGSSSEVPQLSPQRWWSFLPQLQQQVRNPLPCQQLCYWLDCQLHQLLLSMLHTTKMSSYNYTTIIRVCLGVLKCIKTNALTVWLFLSGACDYIILCSYKQIGKKVLWILSSILLVVRGAMYYAIDTYDSRWQLIASYIVATEVNSLQ